MWKICDPSYLPKPIQQEHSQVSPVSNGSSLNGYHSSSNNVTTWSFLILDVNIFSLYQLNFLCVRVPISHFHLLFFNYKFSLIFCLLCSLHALTMNFCASRCLLNVFNTVVVTSPSCKYYYRLHKCNNIFDKYLFSL
uniref:Uncharacterized protein n=1 Tax=Heterorhabditis bacteriophora TaxID=37862 RepID=A0A1I7X7H2_HETBA